MSVRRGEAGCGSAVSQCCSSYLCDAENRATAAKAVVLCAKDDMGDAHEAESVGAHDAGLDGDVERCAVQPAARCLGVAIEGLCAFVKRHQLWGAGWGGKYGRWWLSAMLSVGRKAR